MAGQKRSRTKAAERKFSHGLWIDHALLRRHLQNTPRLLFNAGKDDAGQTVNHHYLELADLVLKRSSQVEDEQRKYRLKA
jgi:hypothetical protein